MLKKVVVIFLFTLIYFGAIAQCSICTKTAQQLGDGPASGMNTGIIYLAFIPFLVMIIIGVRWWINEKKNIDN